MNSTAPHRRYNPLIGEWLLLSPHRTKHPWLGQDLAPAAPAANAYEPQCYLCPGNKRAAGATNPDYRGTYVFDNDFASLLPENPSPEVREEGLFWARSVTGISRVVCFTQRHDLTLAQMQPAEVEDVIRCWVDQERELGRIYRWVQIFENKGEIMGCSNPHPHGQIWATDFLPETPRKEDAKQRQYHDRMGRPLLLDYLQAELKNAERIVAENGSWVALVPYWAVWPFEILLLPRKHTLRMSELDQNQQTELAQLMNRVLIQYDNIFTTSFPYSMGWHGAPTGDGDHSHWQLHAHYYPPLLRSASVKKFMVGFEMLGCAQRDITPEAAAEIIRQQPEQHYTATTAG